MQVHIICRNADDDRVIPRFTRYLRDHLGWTVGSHVTAEADAVYLSGYFESQILRQWPAVPVGAYFTHREEEPPGNRKAELFDEMAKRVQLRVVTAEMYAKTVEAHGLTWVVPAPVERERFTIPGKRPRGKRGRLVAGFSGYTYPNRRKGEDLAKKLLTSKIGRQLEWRASGRGWPVRTVRYSWAQLPEFYQGLDILVVTSRVEGVPMPPLECLSCGVSIVIPQGVGMLDDLPEMDGIHRYKRGDAKSLVLAMYRAVEARPTVDREALRAVTEPYNIDAFCEAHKEAFMEMVEGPTAGIEMLEEEEGQEPVVVFEVGDIDEPDHEPTGQRGIYCVAFGDPARECALRLMKSAKTHMPDIPICLCSDRKIGPEDILVKQPDGDIGGRKAKLKVYELAPQEWDTVLYLDADTEVVAPITFYFELIEDGWEFVICKDPHLMDTLENYRRRNNAREIEELSKRVHTLNTLMFNGGVWAFARNKRVARFFKRWYAEWDRHAGRDQGALIRAMYSEPLRVYLLGSEWNTFPKYTRGIQTAGLMHYPGDARRWKGMIHGRIDSQEAWRAVDRFMRRRGGKPVSSRSRRRR